MSVAGKSANPSEAAIPVRAVQPVALYDPSTGLPSSSGGTGVNSQQVQGAGASGATAVGNPVGVGGVFTTTRPTFTNGQRGDLQISARGEIYTQLSVGAIPIQGRATMTDGASGALASLLVSAYTTVYNPNTTTWDMMRGDASGIWVNPGLLPASTDRSGTATTTSGGLSVAANSSRRTLTGQNISAVNIGFNEQGGTAAIGTAGTYTVAPGAGFSISTNKLVNFIAASGTAAVTMTET